MPLSQVPLAEAWIRWASDDRNLPRGAGFIMMHPDNYSEQAILSGNPHTADNQTTSIRAFGKPIVFWQFIIAVNDDED